MFLIDNNLSPTLVSNLQSAFGAVNHVMSLGLDKASDLEIWTYAQKKGTTYFNERCRF